MRPLWKTLFIFTKAMLTSAYLPTILLFNVHHSIEDICSSKDKMFTVVLFIIAFSWKQPYVHQREDEYVVEYYAMKYLLLL